MSRRRGSDQAAAPPPLPEPLAVPAFDSHCHLDLLQAPVASVLADARAVGIDRIVTIGIDVPSSQWAADQAAAHEDVWAAVAIHPNEAAEPADPADPGSVTGAEEIARLAALPQVRAVGETGLDYYRDWAVREHQQLSFRAHIAIAKRTGKALVIHDRQAHEDVLRILREEGAPQRVVMHCFSGDAEMAKICAEAGYYVSFAGNVTFKNAVELREAAEVVPPELLLAETDAPFMAPVPHRGKPNSAYLVPVTIRALADIKSMDVDALCAAVAANGAEVFGPW